MKIILFLLVLLTPLCSQAGKAVKKPQANIEKRHAPAFVPAAGGPGFCIFGGQSGKAVNSDAAFKAIVWKNDVVYVGETHDQALDHLAQLDALKAMKIAHGSKIAVGFEMLNQTLQPILDDYAAGRITQEEFLNKADWKAEWGFDFNMYKPIFDFIAQNKLKALALNVPKKIVSKVARAGLAGLTPEEAAALPNPVTITTHKKYLDYLKESYSGHGDGPMAKIMTFENYLASMCAWNEGMGARVADFLNANPGYAVLVVAGNGHVMYNAAIPAAVKARVKGVRQASFYTEDAAACPETMPQEHKDLASYIWYIKHPPKPEPAAAAAAPAADPGK